MGGKQTQRSVTQHRLYAWPGARHGLGSGQGECKSPSELQNKQFTHYELQPEGTDLKTLFHFALGVAATASVLAPTAAAPLQPTKGWVVEFADQQCVAAREYGSADKPLVIILKPSPMGSILQITFVRPATRGPTRQVMATIAIGDGPQVAVRALAFDSKSAKVRSVRINLPEEATARLASSTTISIGSKDEVNGTFAVSQMDQLAKAMKDCISDLQTHWNIGPKHEKKYRARAKANLASYISDGDYPVMAVDRAQGGTVEFALLINEAGRVADCTVIASSNVPSLDAQSCAILVERARFEPAIGIDGKPIKDAVTSRITWKIP